VFGFGASLFAVIARIVAADFFFAPPVFDFGITEWEDVLGLVALELSVRWSLWRLTSSFHFPIERAHQT